MLVIPAAQNSIIMKRVYRKYCTHQYPEICSVCESRFRLSGSHGISITMTHNHDMHVITFVCAKRILNLANCSKGFYSFDIIIRRRGRPLYKGDLHDVQINSIS